MSIYAYNLLRIARSLRESDPVAAYDLEKSVRAAVINPGAASFEKTVKEAVDKLEKIKSVIEDSLKAFSQYSDEEMDEFAAWFSDKAEAEAISLENLVKNYRFKHKASTRYAGPMDWLKGLFKRKPKEDESTFPSYRMEESEMDKWLEGEEDWDSAKAIQKESLENKEFFDGVSSVVSDFDKVSSNPTKSLLNGLLKKVNDLIASGKRILGVKPKKDIEPVKEAPKKMPSLPGPKKPKDPGFPMILHNYVDKITESSDNLEDLNKYVTEFLNYIRKDMGKESVSIAARREMARRLASHVLVNPRSKTNLIPVILKLNG